ncbi:MAG: hypothetical protein DYG98_19965 [Haliscomenobacteraceae bacterium CHB4]|nr:hypothetical protein [Haliscomenobacteraceae bacterium CHB4]
MAVPKAWRKFAPRRDSTNVLSGFDRRQRYLDKHMKHIFFSILSALAFSFCQTAEPAKKRSLECYVRYLEPEAQTHAEATLREGDVSLQAIQPPDGILYQGREMKLLAEPVISFRLDKPGKFEDKHVFSWKDPKGQVQQFDMQLSPIRQFGFGSKTLSRQQPATLRWEGDALVKGETLVFMWENEALRKTVPMEVIQVSGEPAIGFPAAKIAQLDPGQWTYYLVRKRLIKADINGVAASGIIEYYTKLDTVQVK